MRGLQMRPGAAYRCCNFSRKTQVKIQDPWHVWLPNTPLELSITSEKFATTFSQETHVEIQSAWQHMWTEHAPDTAPHLRKVCSLQFFSKRPG
jgi:hypothetical protein